MEPKPGIQRPNEELDARQLDGDSIELRSVKVLLNGNQTTEEKAAALLRVLESDPDPELDHEDDDSSIEPVPWPWEIDMETAVTNVEMGTEARGEWSLGPILTQRGIRRRNVYCCIRIPLAIIRAVFYCFCAVVISIGQACSEMARSVGEAIKPRKKEVSRELDIEAQQHAAITPSVAPNPSGPRIPDRFELYLKKSFFDENVRAITALEEPQWERNPFDQRQVPLFPGWDETLATYPLRPQGQFVAETEQALCNFLDQIEIGVNMQVMATGGGVTSTGLPGLLRRSFTPYQWLGMWRSSSERHIRILPEVLWGSDYAKYSKPKEYDHLLPHELQELQRIENELLGLDKYKGGDSKYLTVISHSDDFVGVVSLFQAKFSDDQKEIIQLDRIAMIPEVPKAICAMLREEVTPNRYEVGRVKRKLKCFSRGDQPSPYIVEVSNQERPWKTCGGGWRKAMNISDLGDGYSSGEGLVATIPQILGLLHLQYLSLSRLGSSPVLVFDTPLDTGKGHIRRGALLDDQIRGMPPIGGNTKIAVVFPSNSAWAQEQFFWA